nr:hypothetical protein [Tanacetum cinerariifolium]
MSDQMMIHKESNAMLYFDESSPLMRSSMNPNGFCMLQRQMVVKTIKNVNEHKTYFISNFMNESLSSLSMGENGGKIGRNGGIAFVDLVVRWSDDRGGISEESHLLQDLFLRHKGFRLSKKSVISSQKISRQEGWFKVHESWLWECLVGDIIKWGEDSFEDMSMTLVVSIFLGGFLVDDEALKAIFRED